MPILIHNILFILYTTNNQTVDLILKNKPHEINHKMVDVKRAQARGVAPPSIHPDKKEVSSILYYIFLPLLTNIILYIAKLIIYFVSFIIGLKC